MTDPGRLQDALDRAHAGGPERHREKSAEQGKLPVRERVELLLDEGSFVEDALLANWEQDGLGADGVVTGLGTIGGRPGRRHGQRPHGEGRARGAPRPSRRSCASRSSALSSAVPMIYLVDSAGRAHHRAGRRCSPAAAAPGGSSTTRSRCSGVVPQVCVLFGPSAAGGAYIPAFCDIVIMRDGNASMYLGSPRMAEMVIGEKVTLEEMGGARMHTGVSGCGHVLVKTDEEGIAAARRYLSFMPSQLGGRAAASRRPPSRVRHADPRDRPGRREQAVRHARR